MSDVPGQSAARTSNGNGTAFQHSDIHVDMSDVPGQSAARTSNSNGTAFQHSDIHVDMLDVQVLNQLESAARTSNGNEMGFYFNLNALRNLNHLKFSCFDSVQHLET